MKEKWRTYANLTYALVALSFAHFIWAIPLAGTANPSEMSRAQFTAFIVFIVVESITFILSFFFAINCRLSYNRSIREQKEMLETLYRNAYECRAYGLERYDRLVEIRYFARYTQRIVIYLQNGLYRYKLECFQAEKRNWAEIEQGQNGGLTLQEVYDAIEDFRYLDYDEVIEKSCSK